jgi:hypothetical protein
LYYFPIPPDIEADDIESIPEPQNKYSREGVAMSVEEMEAIREPSFGKRYQRIGAALK